MTVSAELEHDIVFDGDADWAFEACRDVTKWPLFMPAVMAASFIEQGENSDRVQITAQANEQTWTWQSERQIDKKRRTIAFTRLSPPEPIQKMSGSWEINDLGDGAVRVRLRHAFQVSKAGNEADFLSRSIRSNATRDLAALAELAACESVGRGG